MMTIYLDRPAALLINRSLIFMVGCYREVYRSLFFVLITAQILCTAHAQQGVNEKTLEISIKAIPGLQYDIVRFKVKPGTKVKLSLSNSDDMSHNLLITKPDTRLKVVNAALQLAEKGPQMNYIPKIQEVLWAVPVVAPGQVRSVSFTTPSKQGVYPFVCTYPGHGFLMYGAMYVMQEGSLPDINHDMNIPEARRKDSLLVHANHPAEIKIAHPYTLTPPYLYRAFLEGASPAAIAVCLPGELNYCWDAGTCKLRFAWKGGFIDNTDLWRGHFDASAKVLGDIFFRDNIGYPFQLEGQPLSEIKFKGYRLVDNYPEFHYTLNGLDIYELIREKADGNGIIRQFRIPKATQAVWFCMNGEDVSIDYEFSSGKKEANRLLLSAHQAKSFTITMTSYHLVFQRKKK